MGNPAPHTQCPQPLPLPSMFSIRPLCHARLGSKIYTQVRGAKKLPKRKKITVQLLKDTRFGSTGDVIEVTRGLMRNTLYPSYSAAYVLRDQKLAIPIDVSKEDVAARPVISLEERLQILRPNLPSELRFREKVQSNSEMLFGSVDTNDIREKLIAAVPDSRVHLDKIKIQLPDGKPRFKEVGTFTIELVGGGASFPMKVVIEKDVSGVWTL